MSSIEQDVSERERIEEAMRRSEIKLQEQASKLAQANRRKNDFLALLGHELRTPLASIDNAVHLLRLRNQGHDEYVQQALQVIGRQVRQLTRLADDLLDIGRITSGKLKLKPTVLNVSKVISNALETVRPDANAHQHQLSVSLPPHALFVHADGARLEQVLTNLLGNAIKYTEDNGRIWLSAEQVGQWIEISVKDNGIGIEPDILPHVFDNLSQSDSHSLRSRNGFGLGLALVQRLVALHGGAVHAFSAGRRCGSQFKVRLPASGVRPANQQEKAADHGLARTRVRILVVDDDVDTANSLGTLLHIRGYQARVVHDGRTALKTAEVFNPQVVLLDIGLPDMDGYEVAKHLRKKTQPGVHLLIVALTGYELEEGRIRHAGVDEHLLKPTSLQSVEALLCARMPS